MLLKEELLNKWAGVLDSEHLPQIKDEYRRSTIARVLENTENELNKVSQMGYSQHLLEGDVPVNATGAGISNFDPILISLVRRAMPNLVAYDICGVQPMTGPTGLIFAIRSRYSNQAGDETFYNEVKTDFSSVVTGANTLGQKHVGGLPGQVASGNNITANLASSGIYNFGSAMSTAQGEALGATGNVDFNQMAFSIEKVTVEAKTRALKGEYTIEIAQDLKAIHGLDAEGEVSRMLSTEMLAEINREVVRTINVTAVPGSQINTTTAGIFDLDTDANGRWSVEKFKGLMFHLETECNQIAKETRRGKGNIMICSSNVASALRMAGVLSYTPALNSNNLQVDDTGNTFAGVLNGQIRVYIDPYAMGEYCTVGYKGANAFDAGLFYCPYVPLQLVRAVDQDTFHPKIGFKTRYGMVANPFAEGLNKGLGALTKDSNKYYRRSLITNLM